MALWLGDWLDAQAVGQLLELKRAHPALRLCLLARAADVDALRALLQRYPHRVAVLFRTVIALLAGVMIDGIELAGMTHLVALGITPDGTKLPLSLREGSTETATVATALLADLVDRGLRLHQEQLFVLDGGNRPAFAQAAPSSTPPSDRGWFATTPIVRPASLVNATTMFGAHRGASSSSEPRSMMPRITSRTS